jgi:hypothetical protein
MAAMNGVNRSFTNAVTTALNAAPMKVPAALGLLALVLTAAAVQIVGAQLFRDASEIAGFAPRY